MFLFKKYKTAFIGLMLVLSFFTAAPAVLAADEPGAQKAAAGLDITANQAYGKDVVQKNSDLPTIIGRVVGTGLAFLGVVFFTLLLYAGLTWILSLGKEEKINQAKEMITAAVLGLIVVLGAYAVTLLVARIFTAVPK